MLGCGLIIGAIVAATAGGDTDALRAELETLRGEVRQLRNENTAIRSEVTDALAKSGKRIDTLVAAGDKLKTDLAETGTEREALKAELGKVRKDIAEAEGTVGRLLSLLSKLGKAD